MNLRVGITGALLTSELIDARAYYLCLEQFKVNTLKDISVCKTSLYKYILDALYILSKHY